MISLFERDVPRHWLRSCCLCACATFAAGFALPRHAAVADDAATEKADGEAAADDDAQTEELERDRDDVDRRAASSPQYSKHLDVIERQTRDGDLLAAARLLQDLLNLPEDALWRGDAGQWLPLKAEAERRLSRLPAEGMVAYRREFGPVAQRMLDEGGHGPENLAAVSSRYLHTTAGQSAALQLAAMHFDRGEFSAAARWFARLETTDAELPAESRLRAALAYHQVGRARQAEAIVATIGRESWNDALSAYGVPVRDGMPAPFGVSDAPVLENWPMPQGTPQRTGLMRGDQPLLLMRWSRPLTDRFTIAQQIDDLELDLADASRAAIPAFQPITVGGRVAYRTFRGLAVCEIRTGELLWESPESMSAERLLVGDAEPGDANNGRPAVAPYGPNQFDQHQVAGFVYRNAVNGQLTSDGRRLFAIENNALMLRPGYSSIFGRARSTEEDPFGRDWASNQIVAYDLETGRIAWEIGGRQLDGAFATPLDGTFFFGPPTPCDNELFVIGERNDEVRLFVLDADGGELVWSQPLANSPSQIATDGVRRYWACPPAIDAELIICPTTAGWLIAIDRETRRILWAHRYAKANADGQSHVARRMHSLQPLNTRWESSAPILSKDRVFVTPSEQPDELGADAPRLMCLNAVTGELIWERAKDDLLAEADGTERLPALYVAGAYDDRLIVVGRGAVIALSQENGEVVWQTALPPGSSEVTGRAAVLDGALLVPAGSRLVAFDCRTGAIGVTMQTLDQAGSLGHLISQPGTLLSLSPSGVVAFEQQASFHRELAARFEQDPTDVETAIREAEMHFVTGEFSQALAALDRVQPDAASPLQSAHHRLTFDVLVRLAADELTGRDEEFSRAAALATGADEQIAVHTLSARRHIARGEFVAAWQNYEAMAQFAPETIIPDGELQVRIDPWLAGRMADLWNSALTNDREIIERHIEERLNEQDAAPEGAQRWAEIYAFHPASHPWEWRRVEHAVRDGDFAAAEFGLRRMIATAERDRAAHALLRLGQLWMQIGQLGDARACFLRLRHEFADASVEGRAATTLAAQHLADVQFQDLLATDDEIADWSSLNFDVAQSRTDYSRDYGQDPVLRGDDAPFFRKYRVRFESRPQALLFSDREHDELYWSVPLRSAPQSPYSQATAMVANGLQPVVLHRGILHAISLTDRRLLWTAPLTSRVSGTHVRNVMPDNVCRLGNPRTFASQQQFPGPRSRATGMLAAANARYVAHYGRGEFCLLDSLTGTELWRRTRIAPGTVIDGDEQTIYVVPYSNERRGPDPAQTYALRAVDGTPIEIDGLAELAAKGIALQNGRIVTVDVSSDGDADVVEIAAVRPADGSVAWSSQFEGKLLMGQLDERSMVFVERDSGRCRLLDLTTGDVSFLGIAPQDPLKNSSLVHAVGDGMHVYLLIDHLENDSYFHISSPFVRVNGTVVAMSRDENVGTVWQQQVKNQNLLLTQFRHSPLLVFVRYENQQLEKPPTSYLTLELLALEKRTGRIAAQHDSPSTGGTLYQVDLDLAQRKIEIRSHSERLRIQATSDLAEPAPADGP